MGIYHILLMVIWSRNSMVLTQPSSVPASPSSQYPVEMSSKKMNQYMMKYHISVVTKSSHRLWR